MSTKISVEKAFMKANFHAKKGEVAEAKKIYQAVLRVFPKNKKVIRLTIYLKRLVEVF